MFKLAQIPTYKWPVTVSIPADGGKYVKATFTAEFKAPPQEDIERIVKAGRDGDENADIIQEVLVGWSSVQDEDGNEMPYGEVAKAKLLNIPYARMALLDAFFTSVHGGGARRKN